MVLERPELFSGREWALFLLACLAAGCLSLLLEYGAYRDLTRFDDALIDAEVVHHYLKEKQGRRYGVLKLRMAEGAVFYTTGSPYLRDLTGYRLRLRIRTNRVGFWAYLKGFFAYSSIVRVYPERVPRVRIAKRIVDSHADPEEGTLFAALLTASPMGRELRAKLSALGVSHLLAISGFHLGVLSLVGYGLLVLPVWFLQSRWFPWINRRKLLFVMITPLLFAYLHFLDFVPSLSRAFAMTVVGYLLYDRGIRVISMQTLGVVVVLLLAFWPRLGFSLGFWLSVEGVFFILLFLRYAPPRRKVLLFVALHGWVYLMMLPTALWLFGHFSLWHPLSIFWSMGFMLYYPLVLAVHLTGMGALLDGSLQWLLAHGEAGQIVSIPGWAVALQLGTALGALALPRLLWPAFGAALAVFVGAIYQVA